MTDRESLTRACQPAYDAVYPLIRQYGTDAVDNARIWRAVQTALDALIDAGWRPPPGGDLIKQALRVVARKESYLCAWCGAEFRSKVLRGQHHLRCPDRLARPAQQDKADAIALLWPDMADEGSETPEARADDLTEQGRRLASQRDDLIAAGADPAELAVPLAPATPVAANTELNRALNHFRWCWDCGARKRECDGYTGSKCCPDCRHRGGGTDGDV